MGSAEDHPSRFIGFTGAMVAFFLFLFTASRGNRLLLHYLKEREIMLNTVIRNSSSSSNSKNNAWYNDTRLMFYSLCIFSAVSYATSTMVLVMAPPDSKLRKDNIESDALTLANIAAYLSMVTTVVWTIVHGISLEWKREHGGSLISGGGGGAGGGIRSANNNFITSSSQNNNSSPTRAGAGGGMMTANRESMTIDSYSNRSESQNDIYYDDVLGGDTLGGTDQHQQQQQQHRPDSSVPSYGNLANTNYGSSGDLKNAAAGGGAGGGGQSQRSSTAIFGNINNTGADGGALGAPITCKSILDALFPYRLILSVLFVISFYIVITILTEDGSIKGANFSSGFSGFLGLVCGVLALGGTIFLIRRGAAMAARRFGLALAILCVCLLARCIVVLHAVQTGISPNLSPMVLPLIDSFSISCVIVVLPSRKFCLCFDV